MNIILTLLKKKWKKVVPRRPMTIQSNFQFDMNVTVLTYAYGDIVSI
ncbi:MAG: hypothetical protein JNL75_06720 [Chitinophagales bacterium]|nr:hypothetical protein [Chitinophagales bacterium]